ncbi:hypothetical protein [Citrobacter amalonaticus]|jgi:hypothetical protein|uniref:hypothetical protein n=1 Tax=Citrobacter amalonaticus TaxID=35703 RepID=UPI00388FFAF6|nr:hypothetical protein [Citrobacter amalonaticus]
MSRYIAIVVKYEKIEDSELIKPIEWAIYDLLDERMHPDRYTLLSDAEEEITALDIVAIQNEKNEINKIEKKISRRNSFSKS